jgi:hypothetical protein
MSSTPIAGDYIKAEAPETRASLGMFALWNPDVFVDLHTTDGSLHGYALTYSPSLNPVSPSVSEMFCIFRPPVQSNFIGPVPRLTINSGNVK